MRILFLCPTTGRAGTWFRCFFLARGLVRAGHRVTLVKVSPTSRVRWEASVEEGVELVEMPRFWGSRWSRGNTRLPSDLLARGLWVLKERYDVVHVFTHQLNSVLPGLLSQLRLHRPTLVADWDDLWTDGGLHGHRPERGALDKLSYLVDELAEQHFKRLAREVVVVSDDLRQRAIAHGVAPDHITLVGNGAPVDAIQPGDRAALRRELGLPLDRSIGVFVGYGQYDVDMVLGALAKLAPELRAMAVFTGPHGEKILEQAEKLGIADRVRIAGEVPYSTMAKYIAAADLGLLPYADKPLNRARWPIKLGDYLAAGLPVLTCAVGEMGRFVTEWKVGRAAAPNVDAFAQAWAELAPVAAGMQRHAREVAEKNSWDAYAASLLPVYSRARARA